MCLGVDFMNFGEKLRHARIEKGYTQEYVARQIGVSKSTYTGYEKGWREPDLFKIKKIISVLEVNSSWLLGVDEGVAGVTPEEWQMLARFRALDSRGKSAVLASLNHEFTAAFGEEPDTLPRPVAQ